MRGWLVYSWREVCRPTTQIAVFTEIDRARDAIKKLKAQDKFGDNQYDIEGIDIYIGPKCINAFAGLLHNGEM